MTGDLDSEAEESGEVGAPGASDEAEEPAPSRKRRRPPPLEGERRSRLGPALRGASMALLVLLGSCVGGAVLRWVAMILTPAPQVPSEVVEVRPTPSVVVAVRDLARLESASYHVERVIDLSSRQRRLFGLVEAEDSILLVAAADVVAGVDLSEIADEDVRVSEDGRQVTVVLPAVRVLSARLDNDRTYVHHRETDLLARRRENLETDARREAERTLEDAALEAGILERAQRNAAATVEALLRSLGFRHIDVRFETDE
jgi:hypothetical protein